MLFFFFAGSSTTVQHSQIADVQHIKSFSVSNQITICCNTSSINIYTYEFGGGGVCLFFPDETNLWEFNKSVINVKQDNVYRRSTEHGWHFLFPLI